MHNKNSLDTLCAALAYAIGIEAPEKAAAPNPDLVAYIDEIFGGEKADRIFMYNPDAIGEWIYRKYSHFCKEATACTDFELPLATVMPSVTPVCFGTMYTGAQPAVHGIQKYDKPVIKIDTLFDALIRAGKKPALITYRTCSLGKIYLEREMDYYHFDADGIEAANAKSPEALAELRLNSSIFGSIYRTIREHWTAHNTLLGFAMDHGCHEIDGPCGSHGLDMDEDINILHLYKGLPKKEN